MRRILPLSALLFAACAHGHALEGNAPVPDREKALDCAMGQATAQGYTPAKGGLADGYVLMIRQVANSGGEVGKEAATRIMSLGLVGSQRVVQENLTLSSAGGMLNVKLLGVFENGKGGEPTKHGKEQALQILSTCGKTS